MIYKMVSLCVRVPYTQTDFPLKEITDYPPQQWVISKSLSTTVVQQV